MEYGNGEENRGIIGKENYDSDNSDVNAELQYEKNRLEGIIEVINREIIGYINKRKQVAKNIIEYRKRSIDEFEDDEDKIIEYFDHERFVVEETYKTIDRKLKELTVLSSSPYFGKVNFYEEGFGEDNIYVGRFGLIPEGTYEPLIVDWRAPVASLFYAGGLGKTKYKAPSGDVEVDILKKTQFIIKKEKLIGMFDSAVDVKDEILQLILSQNAGDKLKDIVMSIQAEQDNIIRQPRNKAVVVNGVAGSGKTTIALHRVAYLLYNFRDVLKDKVMILGPNSIFMEYIAEVLPSLGEVGVNQKTFKQFALELLDIDDDDVLSFKEYMEAILCGNKSFIGDVIYKNNSEFIDTLDKVIDKLNNDFYALQEVKFNGKVVIPVQEINQMFNEYYKNMPLFRRTNKIRRIIFSKLKDARDERVREIQEEYKKTIENATEEELRLNRTNYEFQRKLKIRETVIEVMNVKKSLVWLDNPRVFDIYQYITKDDSVVGIKKLNSLMEAKRLDKEKEDTLKYVPLKNLQINGSNYSYLFTTDDLAPLLYLKMRLEGLKSNEEIKHVIIDEAQDYSAIQFKVIREITGCSGMTVVGDSNQRIIPIKGEVPMVNLENIIQDIDIENFRLNKSYRSTKEIMEYANKYLKEEHIVPIVRSGKPVTEHQVSSEQELFDSLIALIKQSREEGLESIAVICRDLRDTERIGKHLKNNGYAKLLDREELIYTSGSVVMPSYLAKGLEFDSVILIDNDSKYENEDKIKYVMATRALHQLTKVTIAFDY
ncbi:MAG: RNA polymerase recycling motor HelD [Bacillota bacterium]|nr:RNA polymerase recycling motor HelD [Bacillota bacterium]